MPRTAPMARRRDGDIASYRHYTRVVRTAMPHAPPSPPPRNFTQKVLFSMRFEALRISLLLV